jgi:signal peptidase I
MRPNRWIHAALRAYPQAWRARYESEVLDLTLELREERGVGEYRIALGLLLNAPRVWWHQRRTLEHRRILAGVALALAGTATALAALLVPASPAASSPFRVVSGAMAPTLKLNEVVQVAQLSSSAPLASGQIVVFRNPPTLSCGGDAAKYLVKRVIGLPGQTISLSRGYVLINGQRLGEGWLPSSEQGITTPGPAGTPYSLEHPFKIPPPSYYVLGDNRIDSCDSRYWGPVARSLVYGVVSSSHQY